MLKGRRVSPVDLYETARKSLHLVGYQGLSMNGLDKAVWDALAKAADVPLCVLLGGSVGPVKAYNSSGLWLQSRNPRHLSGFRGNDSLARLLLGPALVAIAHEKHGVDAACRF